MLLKSIGICTDKLFIVKRSAIYSAQISDSADIHRTVTERPKIRPGQHADCVPDCVSDCVPDCVTDCVTDLREKPPGETR